MYLFPIPNPYYFKSHDFLHSILNILTANKHLSKDVLMFRFVKNILYVYMLSDICYNDGHARNHGVSLKDSRDTVVLHFILTVVSYKAKLQPTL